MESMLFSKKVELSEELMKSSTNVSCYHFWQQSRYASGTYIVRFPGGGYLHSFPFLDSSESGASSGLMKEDSSILELVEVGTGRISVYGDSNCLDSSHMVTNCYWLLKKILDFTSANIKDPVLFSDLVKKSVPLHKEEGQLPTRRTDVNFSTYSAVLEKDMICQKDSRFEIWKTKGFSLQMMGKNRRLPGFPNSDVVRDSNMTMENSNLGKIEGFNANKGSSSSSIVGNKYSKTMDVLGLLRRDELDTPGVVAAQWLIPILIACTGKSAEGGRNQARVVSPMYRSKNSISENLVYFSEDFTFAAALALGNFVRSFHAIAVKREDSFTFKIQ